MLRLIKARGDKGGFLLLEVLVSVLIISVGIIYVLRSFSSSVRALETSARFLKSVSLAKEMLWDIEEKGFARDISETGSFDGEENYSWSMEADNVKDAALDKIKLKVKWKGPDGRQTISVDTYLWNEEEST